MKKSNTEEYRNNITIHLTKICSDIEHIKEKVNDNNKHLLRLNGRVRENENQISWIRGVGKTTLVIIGVFLTWLGIKQ